MSSSKKHEEKVCKEHTKQITLITEVIKDGVKFDRQGNIVNPPPLLGNNLDPYRCTGNRTECYVDVANYVPNGISYLTYTGVCINGLCYQYDDGYDDEEDY